MKHWDCGTPRSTGNAFCSTYQPQADLSSHRQETNCLKGRETLAMKKSGKKPTAALVPIDTTNQIITCSKV